MLAPQIQQGVCFSPQEVWARLQAKREIKEVKSEAEEEKPKDNPKLKYKGRVWKHTSDNIEYQWYIDMILTLPETNIAPENWWLEYYFPIGEAYFQGLC